MSSKEQPGRDGSRKGPNGASAIALGLSRVDRMKLICFGVGILLFLGFFFLPPFSPAVDPQGKAFELSRDGQLAVAIFLLAATWWIFEVVPIGVTSIAIVSLQALLLSGRGGRQVTAAFTDFMDPSIWLVLSTLAIGMAFNKTGLTRRMAYKMVGLMGEKTRALYLGCFGMTAVLTLFMDHATAAATAFPLLMAIYTMYDEEGRPTRFGKGLFIGMAYSCGAGSIVTFLGSARAPVATGFFKTMSPGDKEIGFFDLPYYLLPLSAVMVALIWLVMLVLYKPERSAIPGLRERAAQLYARLGPISLPELTSVLVVSAAFLVLAARRLIPALQPLDTIPVLLIAALLLFLLRVLGIDDLERMPWNIILLFGGSMSMGYCLWQTGASHWMAVTLVGLVGGHHWMFFLLAAAFTILVTTNFMLNVPTLALCLPVALAVSPYVHVHGQVVLFATLAAAGMPFALLTGAASNAIAYESGQFTAGEFFRVGVIMSMIVMAVLALFVFFVWPYMGMPTVAPGF